LSICAEALGRIVESRRKAEEEKRIIYGKLGNLKQLQDEQ